MKKILYFIPPALAAGYLTTVLYVDKFEKDLYQNNQSSVNITDATALQAFNILSQHGCRYCHVQNSPLPFYTDWPIAKQLVQKDQQQGLQHFDMSNLLTQLQENKPISAVDLAKLKLVLENSSMPPTKFLALHWRSKLSFAERDQLLNWIDAEHTKLYPASKATQEFKHESVQPLTTTFKTDPAKVALGQELFHDKRLSADNTISCASCHDLKKGGTDRQDVSTGMNGAKGGINAPTVYNAVFNTKQFWDGRANDLHEQAGGPPLNPIEMGSTSWAPLIEKLKTDPILQARFNKVYADGITENNVKDAIAEFEKTLVTPNSRFDQYLTGNKNALTKKEQEGYALFKAYQCQTCHVGESMGGQSFEIMGLKGDYFKARGKITEADNGRYNVTHDAKDMHRFKVPNLRNIELTAPYFHDAHAKTLEQAVADMAKYQVGANLSQDEIDKITAFLKTLTGEYNGKKLE